MFDENQQLRIPGPAPVPPRVFRATTRPMINHRGKVFKELLGRLQPRLQRLFATQHQVYVVTGSGTAGMETAVVNVISPGDKVLVLVGGMFGRRWAELAKAYGADVRLLEYPWERGAEADEVAAALTKEPDIRVIFATHNESSTAVLNDIEGISRARRQAGSEAILVVDSVSGLGGAPLKMDEWGVDLVVTGSQKCLMLPPGLALVAANDRAWALIEAAKAPRFYFDLRKYRSSLQKGETPWTPNVSLVQALEEALDMLDEEGTDAIFRRHVLMRDMMRAGLASLGLELFVSDRWASPTVTAVHGPKGSDVEAFRKVLNTQYGVIVSGGQGDLAGRIFRIGHMGFATPLDMLTTLAAVELALSAVGYPVSFGTGVRAAQEVWAAWH